MSIQTFNLNGTPLHSNEPIYTAAKALAAPVEDMMVSTRKIVKKKHDKPNQSQIIKTGIIVPGVTAPSFMLCVCNMI